MLPARDLIDRRGRVTVAAELLFDGRPQREFPNALVRVLKYGAYSMMGDHIRFEIFPNRVEITSPGRFPGLVSPDTPLEIKRSAQNPRIARVCADLGIARELGEGILRIFTEMRQRGFVDPIYRQSSSSVTLTLLASDALPGEVVSRLTGSALAILDALRLAGQPLGTGQLAELAAPPSATREQPGPWASCNTRAATSVLQLGVAAHATSGRQRRLELGSDTGDRPRQRGTEVAEDTRFELVRGCPQPAFQASALGL